MRIHQLIEKGQDSFLDMENDDFLFGVLDNVDSEFQVYQELKGSPKNVENQILNEKETQYYNEFVRLLNGGSTTARQDYYLLDVIYPKRRSNESDAACAARMAKEYRKALENVEETYKGVLSQFEKIVCQKE